MFKIFKKVSYSEQTILTNVAMDLRNQINNLPYNFKSKLPIDKYDALLKYENAAREALKWGHQIDGSDTMPRILYNKALKELSAASRVLDETEKLINKISKN